MENRSSYILVGGFVITLLAGLFIFSLWLAKIQLQETRDTYYIYFTGSVTGLQAGSPVRYRGVPTGTVTDIRLDPENVARVRVTVEVQQDTPIKTDSIASLELQGITGGAYVQIIGGTAHSERLKDAENSGVPVIPSRASSLAELVDAAPQILNRSLEAVQRVTELLNPANQQSIADILANTQALTGGLAGATSGVGDTVAQLRGTLQNMDSLVNELRKTMTAVGPHLDETVVQTRQSLASISSDFRELSQSLKQTSAQMNTLIAENREPVRDFTGTGLYELTLLITQLRDLSVQVSRVVTRIDNDPSNFLFGGTRQGVEVRGK